MKNIQYSFCQIPYFLPFLNYCTLSSYREAVFQHYQNLPLKSYFCYTFLRKYLQSNAQVKVPTCSVRVLKILVYHIFIYSF